MSWRTERDISGFPVRRSDEAASRYRAAGHWSDQTLTQIASARTREDPARTLLLEGDRKLTRGEAWDGALRLARFFAERGLEPGDVVSVQAPNWCETATIALAARMCGLVLNPIPPIYRDAELAYILHDCGAKLIFTPGEFRRFDYAAMLARLRPGLPALREVVRLRDASWEQALARTPMAESDLPDVSPSAVMMVMYTSGTTSRAKGVLHSHQTYGFKVRQMAEVWGVGREDVVFMPSPVTHITGAFWSFDMPWVCGSTSVLMDVWSARQGVETIGALGCTVSGGATPFLQQILDVAGDRPQALKSLRVFFCGGTTVSPDLMKEAAKSFPHCSFFRAYGCTEMPSTSMGGAPGDSAQMGAETDGAIIPPTEVKIDAGDGEEGEILVRGPEQFLGYLHIEDNQSAFDEDGFFRTGDLGRRVHGDHLVITGRKKDIIIRSGENISPKEVEDALFLHPDIADVAIVAMPSPATGEKGCAFVIPRPGAAPDLASIRRFLESAGLARQKFPEHLVLVEDLPRVPSGKVRKDVLRTEAKKLAEESPS